MLAVFVEGVALHYEAGAAGELQSQYGQAVAQGEVAEGDAGVVGGIEGHTCGVVGEVAVVKRDVVGSERVGRVHGFRESREGAAAHGVAAGVVAAAGIAVGELGAHSLGGEPRFDGEDSRAAGA